MTEFVVNPLLLIYPKVVEKKRSFVIETKSFQPPLIVEDVKLIWAIQSLPKQFTKKSAFDNWNLEHEVFEIREDIWDFLIEEKLILSSTNSMVKDYKEWEKFNWEEAFIYHKGTRDYPFLQMNIQSSHQADEERMIQYSQETPVPKKYLELPYLSKKDIAVISDYEAYLDKIKDLPLSFKHLSFIFDFCFSEKGNLDFGVQGKFLKKTIPSGGARHPLEVYYCSFDNNILPKGVYHFSVKENSFHQIKKDNSYHKLKKATFDLFIKYDENPKGLLVFNSLVGRAMWRYRESRSWRAVMIEIGHAVMIYRLICNLLNIEGYTYHKFNDKLIGEVLNLDAKTNIPLYAATIL